MYNDLCESWRRELEDSELQKLSPDFYAKIADYIRLLKEESRMLDRRTAKAGLLKKERSNVERMVRDLIRTRYRKISQKIVKGEDVPADLLTDDERRIFGNISDFQETFASFSKNVLRGSVAETPCERGHRRVVLRFLKDLPAVIGADMQAYGPFKVDDVASLPVENAKILTKENIAEKVEAS